MLLPFTRIARTAWRLLPSASARGRTSEGESWQLLSSSVSIKVPDLCRDSPANNLHRKIKDKHRNVNKYENTRSREKAAPSERLATILSKLVASKIKA
tara:strand:+ start:1168 stop:1461 length:294 start_codon:yes stop_codon:yes gene_type:complete